MNITAWYFLRTAPGELAPTSRSSFEAFALHDGQLTAGDDGFVRYAEVLVEVVERRAVKVLRTDFHQVRVGDDGRRDPDHESETMAAVAGMLSGSQPLAPDVINAEATFAKRRYERLNTWQPTADDLAKLRELVNAKARSELM
jgi:hypothetical protein